MKHINVVCAVIVNKGRIFACQRGYGEWKDWWEFPGGKIEPGESPEEALLREIREELAIDIVIDRPLTTVDYDYPGFHLTMHCYLCHLKDDIQPHLLEHEAARWLGKNELEEVKWLPADVAVMNVLKTLISSTPLWDAANWHRSMSSSG